MEGYFYIKQLLEDFKNLRIGGEGYVCGRKNLGVTKAAKRQGYVNINTLVSMEIRSRDREILCFPSLFDYLVGYFIIFKRKWNQMCMHCGLSTYMQCSKLCCKNNKLTRQKVYLW